MKRISLEEKIKIFEEFIKTGENLNGNTVYKGYPIGKWGIKIRCDLKNDSRRQKKQINSNSEQLKRLQDLGILERQIESTIDEKIQTMSEWIKKYPKATIVNNDNFEQTLREYASNDNEYHDLLEEYERVKKYYAYTAARKLKGKLTEKQLEDCREANLCGVFGYSTKIQNLAKRYGLKEKIIFHLLNKYDTIEKFVQLYREDELEGDDLKFAQKNIKRAISIGQCNYSNNYDMLAESKQKVMEKTSKTEPHGELLIYLFESVDKVLEPLNTREQKIIVDRYGLKNGKTQTFEDLSEEFGITLARVGQIEECALRKCDCIPLNIAALLIEESDFILPEEKKRISKLEGTINSSNIVFLTVPEQQRELDRDYLLEESKFLVELKERIKERKIQAQKKEDFYYTQEEKRLSFDDKQKEKMHDLEEKLNEKGIPISILCLPERAYKSLFAAGYITVECLMNLNKEDFLKVKGLGEKTVEKIFESLKPYRAGYWEQRCNSFEKQKEVKREELRMEREEFERKMQKERLEFEGIQSEIDEKKEDMEENKTDDEVPISIEKLKLSLRAYNCLKRVGYNTLEDIIDLKEEDFMKISKLGKNSAKEILEKVEMYKKQELGEVQKDKEVESKLSELNSVRIRRDELKGKNSQMKVKLEKAQELLEQYDMVLGENIEDKKTSLDN